jgi:hypothetical protein
MAIVFSKSSGINDSLWKEIDNALVSEMINADKAKNKDDELVNALFNVKKSERFGEKTVGLTGFANFDIVPEGSAAPLDDLQEGYSKLIVHKQFMKKFVCTAEMAEDSSLDIMKTASANFIRAYKRSRAQFASNALTSQSAAFSYGAVSGIDGKTADGEALFSTAHPSIKNAGVTQSNVFKNALGTDTKTLYRLANVGRNFKNDSGAVMGYTFDTIVIPSNTPEMEDFLKRVIRSDLLVGSSNNDVNTQKGLWNLVVDHHWQAASGKAPFILLSSEANKELLGNVFYDRLGLKIMNEVELDTHNLNWSGRCRFSAGFANWRQVILGGADVGSTLA